MDPVNLMYWLQGYLGNYETESVQPVIKHVNEAIAEYEANKSTTANSSVTIKPLPWQCYGDSVPLNDNLYGTVLQVPAQPYATVTL